MIQAIAAEGQMGKQGGNLYNDLKTHKAFWTSNVSTKHHFDELRVSESEPDGLNSPWNTDRIKNYEK